MESRETLIAQVREVLIREDDQIGKQELYLRFINECREAELSEEDFYQDVLKPAHRSIDWAAVDQARKDAAQQAEAAVRKQQEHEQAVREAPALLNRLIAVAFEDGVVESSALQVIFTKARELEQDTSELVTRIDGMLHQKGFRSFPRANFDAPNLMDMLLSADWYDAAHYPQSPGAGSAAATTERSLRIHYFVASKNHIRKGEEVILSWKVTGVKEISISGLGYTKDTTGAHTLKPGRTTTYVLTAGKLSQRVTIEVRRGGFWAGFFTTLLVIAGLVFGGRMLLHYMDDQSTSASASAADTTAPEPVYTPTPLRELKDGAGNSGLTDAEARQLAQSIYGYYDAINQSPVDYDQVCSFYHFPVTNYYGSKRLNKGALMRSLAAYYEEVVAYSNNQLQDASRFMKKRNDKYYVTIEEIYSYRKRKAPDTLVTLNLVEALVLDHDFKILSAGTQRKSTISREYSPVTTPEP